jgi:hypothetical protein
MGHSVDIAVKHYCQVTDDDLARAAGVEEAPQKHVEKAVQKAVQSDAEMHCSASRGRESTRDSVIASD